MRTRSFHLLLMASLGWLTHTAAFGQTAAPGDTLHAYNICFPADFDVPNCGGVPAPNLFTEVQGTCDVLGISYNDVTYRQPGNTCSKVYRTFMVIDWCAYNEACGSQAAQMVVIGRDLPDADGVPGEGVCLLVRDDNEDGFPEVYLSEDLVPAPSELLSIPVPCAPDAHPVWSYTQVISITDTQAPIISSSLAGPFSIHPQACKASAVLQVQATDNCNGPLTIQSLGIATSAGGFFVSPTSFSASWTQSAKVLALGSGNYQVTLDGLPIGSYELGISFRDECGNTSVVHRVPFVVQDLVGPVPVCHNGLSVSLMNNGSGGGILQVDASLFIASPLYDCNGQGPLTSPFNPSQKKVTVFSINRYGTPASPTQQSLQIDCADALTYLPVEVHAWDQLGNDGFCLTYMDVQDNSFLCPTPDAVSIAGKVTTVAGTPLPSVAIEVAGDSVQMVRSNEKGVFRFSKLKSGKSYQISPSYEGDLLEGINGRDLVLLQQQLLGRPVLKTPQSLIAADVDHSGHLDINDLKVLQAIYFKQLNQFPGNKSWRFYDQSKGLDMSVSAMPAMSESRVISNYAARDTALNFRAIKIGDVDGSVRTVPPPIGIELEAIPVRIVPGQRVRVPISLSKMNVLPDGMVGHIDLDIQKARLVQVIPGLVGQREVYWNEETGEIGFSALQPERLIQPEPLFTLELEPLGAGQLADCLQIRESAVGAVGGHDGLLQVGLRFAEKTGLADAGIRVGPNPFRESVTIQFTPAEPGMQVLRIYDVQGKEVYIRQAYAEANPQAWVLDTAVFQGAGIYTYVLQGSWGKVSGKLLKSDR